MKRLFSFARDCYIILPYSVKNIKWYNYIFKKSNQFPGAYKMGVFAQLSFSSYLYVLLVSGDYWNKCFLRT